MKPSTFVFFLIYKSAWKESCLYVCEHLTETLHKGSFKRQITSKTWFFCCAGISVESFWSFSCFCFCFCPLARLRVRLQFFRGVQFRLDHCPHQGDLLHWWRKADFLVVTQVQNILICLRCWSSLLFIKQWHFILTRHLN